MQTTRNGAVETLGSRWGRGVKSWALGSVGLFALALGGCATADPRGTAVPAAMPVTEAVSLAPAAAETADGVAAISPAPARQRPGLGTEWGEERVSPTYDVSFDRANSRRPFASGELRYSDEEGVEALAGYAAEQGRSRMHQTSFASGAVSLSVDDALGNPLDVVRVGERAFVVGAAGERYTILLENRTGHRLEAVTTVDGLDVLNGQPGSLVNRGYIIGPYASVQIDGFRESSERVAAFRFGRVRDSYAAKTGSARNVGVIGVAFFSEAGDRWAGSTDDEARTRITADPFPADPGARDGRFARPPSR